MFGSIGLQISAPSADVDNYLMTTIFTSHIILGYLVVRMGSKHNGMHYVLSRHCR